MSAATMPRQITAFIKIDNRNVTLLLLPLHPPPPHHYLIGERMSFLLRWEIWESTVCRNTLLSPVIITFICTWGSTYNWWLVPPLIRVEWCKIVCVLNVCGEIEKFDMISSKRGKNPRWRPYKTHTYTHSDQVPITSTYPTIYEFFF